MIASMSELETEAQEKEREALETSPWPLEMRNEIWGKSGQITTPSQEKYARAS